MSMSILPAILFATFFMTYTFLWWHAEKPFKDKDKIFTISGLISATVFSILWFLFESNIIIQNEEKKIMLSIISMLLVIITGIVFTTAYNIMSELNERKAKLDKKSKSLDEKLEKFNLRLDSDIKNTRNESIKKLTIFQYRLDLYLYNQTILKEYDQNNISPIDEKKRLFRSTLNTVYSIMAMQGAKDFLDYLSKYYDKQDHGALTDMEYKYIELLEDYFKYCPKEMSEDELQLRQIEKIKKICRS